MTDDLTMWSLIVGALLPPLVAIIQQPRWPDWFRAVVTALACLLAGGVTAYLAADLEGRTWVSSALVVLVAALSTFRGFWKQTGTTQRIESVTTFGGYDARHDVEAGAVEVNAGVGLAFVVGGLVLWLLLGFELAGIIAAVAGVVVLIFRPIRPD